MTCIIGYLDKKKNVGWIGGDSCSSHPKLSTQDIVKVPKVFRSVQFEDVLIGCTSSFRNMDLLHYNDLLFDGVENSSQIDHRLDLWLQTLFQK